MVLRLVLRDLAKEKGVCEDLSEGQDSCPRLVGPIKRDDRTLRKFALAVHKRAEER